MKQTSAKKSPTQQGEKPEALKSISKAEVPWYYTTRFLAALFLLIVIAFVLGARLVEYKSKSASSVPLASLAARPYVYASVSPRPLQPATLTQSAEGKLAFIQDGEIFTIQADRGHREQVTSDGTNKFFLNISPDGQKIAYSFYPKDKEIGKGEYYSGYYSGISMVDLKTKQIRVLVPYEETQNYYPAWSPDGNYISVWVGTGSGAKIIKTDTGEVTLSIVGNETQFVSPIVWFPSTSHVSVIDKGDLKVMQVDGSGTETIATQVDALRRVHEGPNQPEPPLWSKSGRYVTYYKTGDLYLNDIQNQTEVLIREGDPSEMTFLGTYPQAFVAGFSRDEQSLYLLDYKSPQNTVIFDIASGTRKEIANFGQSMVLSPTQRFILGQSSPGVTDTGISMYTFDQGQITSCPQKNFWYSHYTWAGGFSFTTNYSTIDPTGIAVVGQLNSLGRTQVTQIILIDSCYIYDLHQDYVSEIVWFP